MMSIATHPLDGSVFLCSQKGPLYRSRTAGRGAWEEVPVVVPQVGHTQTFHGIGISKAGRIFLSHSSEEEGLWPDGLHGQDLFVHARCTSAYSICSRPLRELNLSPRPSARAPGCRSITS